MEQFYSLEELEDLARRVLPVPIFEYVAGGSEAYVTLRANRAAFADISFVPRVLVDVHQRSQKTTLFGKTYDAPFGIAPMAAVSLSAYRGDIALARSAAAQNLPMIQSGVSIQKLEDVRQVGPTAWFQAYFPADTVVIDRVLDRITRAGHDTLVVSVDVPVLGNREADLRNGMVNPIRPTLRLAYQCLRRPRWTVGTLLRMWLRDGAPHFQNMGQDKPVAVFSRAAPPLTAARSRRDGLSWEHIAYIRGRWKGRLVVKGLLHPADARRAREEGVDGIIVSNHGGRQLDGAVSPLRVLPGIIAEAGDLTVMLDSGVRRGTDVLKALALGAKFVFVGRPFLYAAAIGGDAAVLRTIKLLRDEIDRDMALLGAVDISEIGRGHILGAADSLPSA